MPDPHPLVCRFGALGDMVLLTPLLKQLYLRSGLPCNLVGVGGVASRLFEFTANGIHLPGTKHIERKQVSIAPISIALLSCE